MTLRDGDLVRFTDFALGRRQTDVDLRERDLLGILFLYSHLNLQTKGFKFGGWRKEASDA